jgi:hypothetical protein
MMECHRTEPCHRKELDIHLHTAEVEDLLLLEDQEVLQWVGDLDLLATRADSTLVAVVALHRRCILGDRGVHLHRDPAIREVARPRIDRVDGIMVAVAAAVTGVRNQGLPASRHTDGMATRSRGRNITRKTLCWKMTIGENLTLAGVTGLLVHHHHRNNGSITIMDRLRDGKEDHHHRKCIKHRRPCIPKIRVPGLEVVAAAAETIRRLRAPDRDQRSTWVTAAIEWWMCGVRKWTCTWHGDRTI